MVLTEAGHAQALLGMSFSHGLHKKEMDELARWERKLARAEQLAPMDLGHNKFLESIMIWVNVRAPRYWWQQADTYRISTKQSESTMHTILRGELTHEDFYEPISETGLAELNELIKDKKLEKVKRRLPESFMQRRVWCMSYKTFRNMFVQRKNHKLEEWREFLRAVLPQLEHPEYIGDIADVAAKR
jgi:hypothetical protein